MRWLQRVDPRVLGALMALLGLAAALGRAVVDGEGFGLPLDDAWIHAAFARNLAENGMWGLLLGHSSGGETSPGWPLLLALGELLGPGAPWLAVLIGALAWLCVPPLATCFVDDDATKRMTALLVGLSGPLVFHAISGMETMLFLALGLACLASFRVGRVTSAALLAGFACWMRLDGVVLVFALWIGEADDRRAAGASLLSASVGALRRLWLALAVAAAALLFLSWLEGSFPPATLAGRRWLIGLPSEWHFAGVGDRVALFLSEWLRALSAESGFGHFSARYLSAEPLDGVSMLLRHSWKLAAAFVLSLGFFTLLETASADRRRSAARLIFVWMLWTIVQYCVLLPTRGHAGRYQPQVYVVFALLIALAYARSSSLGRRTRLSLQAAIALVVLGQLAGWVETGRLGRDATRHLHRVHEKAAADLPQLLPEDALVAAFDIGVIAYRAPLALVDISGLSERATAESMTRRDISTVLASTAASHVLLPVFEEDGPASLRERLGLQDAAEFSMEEIARWESEPQEWGPAFLFSGNAYRQLRLYELRAAAGLPRLTQ